MSIGDYFQQISIFKYHRSSTRFPAIARWKLFDNGYPWLDPCLIHMHRLVWFVIANHPMCKDGICKLHIRFQSVDGILSSSFMHRRVPSLPLQINCDGLPANLVRGCKFAHCLWTWTSLIICVVHLVPLCTEFSLCWARIPYPCDVASRAAMMRSLDNRLRSFTGTVAMSIGNTQLTRILFFLFLHF